MDDLDLLEMAAKAAGYDVRWHDRWLCFVHAVPHNITTPPTPAGQRHPWVPLDDDGDALRLAVKLNMLCEFGPSGVYIQASRGVYSGRSDYRRAIVRAAAEIGRSMP